MKIILALLKNNNHPKSLAEISAFISKFGLIKACKETQVACNLIVLEENEKSTKLLKAIKPLLKEFVDAMPNEIPIKLPPMHKI